MPARQPSDLVRPFSRLTARALLLAGVVLALHTMASAHGGGEALVHVPTSPVLAGRPITVLVVDLEPDADVRLDVHSFGRRMPLGEARTDAEGHASVDVVVPADVRDGPALVQAVDPAGTIAQTWVQVGTGTLSTPAPPAGGSTGTVALVAGAAVVLVVVALMGSVVLRRRIS
jgi:hypothetical protein